MACNVAALQNAIPIPLNICLDTTCHTFGISLDANLKKKYFFHTQKSDSYLVYHKFINTHIFLGVDIDIGQKNTDCF